MSDPNVKDVKRSSTRRTSAVVSAKNRSLAGKSAHPAPLVKRSPVTDKAPARKAAKDKTAPAKTKPTKQSTKPAPAEKPAARKSGSKLTHAAKQAKPIQATVAKAPRKRVPQATSTAHIKPVLPVKQASQARLNTSAAATRKQAPPPVAAQRQPTRDEAAALRAFDRAHKEFTRGRFAEARVLFRALVAEHVGVSEITARARTYLAVAETRLRSEPTLPRDADSLYDRGVIELNRGEFVAAQELFERALKREPEAAHIHYGLAATRARLGSISSALESLQRALDLQPRLRVRAQHDQDLVALRNDPEFDVLMFAPRS